MCEWKPPVDMLTDLGGTELQLLFAISRHHLHHTIATKTTTITILHVSSCYYHRERHHAGHHARKTSARWSEETVDRWYYRSMKREKPGQNGKTGEEQKRLSVLSSWSRLPSYIGHGKLMITIIDERWRHCVAVARSPGLFLLLLILVLHRVQNCSFLWYFAVVFICVFYFVYLL